MQNLIMSAFALIGSIALQMFGGLMAILAPPGGTLGFGQISASMVPTRTPIDGTSRQRRRLRGFTASLMQSFRSLALTTCQSFLFIAGQSTQNRASPAPYSRLSIEEEGFNKPRSEVTPRTLVGSVVSFVQHPGEHVGFMNRIALFKASGFLA